MGILRIYGMLYAIHSLVTSTYGVVSIPLSHPGAEVSTIIYIRANASLLHYIAVMELALMPYTQTSKLFF